MNIYHDEKFSLEYNRFIRNKSHTYDNSFGVTVHYVARMIEGRALISTGDYELELQKGDLFYIPLGLKYKSDWSGEQIIWDSVGFTVMPTGVNYPLQKKRSTGDIDNLFEQLYKDFNQDQISIARIYMLIESALADLVSDSLPKNSLVDRAAEYMLESPTASIPEIAKRCAVSVPGLYAAFRAVGTTPVNVRLEAQIKRAVLLLSTTDLTAETIANNCGFGSVVYFYRVLKRFTGKTSRDFRRREPM